MRAMRFILAVLSTAGIIAIGWYAYAVFMEDPLEGKEEYASFISEGMRAMKIEDPGWQVLVLATSRDLDQPREKVWDAWAKLEDWPAWSLPMHRSTFWIGGREWKVGARFQQTIRLSWPHEEFQSTERVVQAFSPDRVSYVRESGPFRSYRTWRFQFLPGGKTRVTTVQVIYGSDIGFVRPLVQRKWQKILEQSVDGLIRLMRTKE